MSDTSAENRAFLFLQGPLSPLYVRIADRLEAAGARVVRINLCAGDRLHWPRTGAIDYRGRFEDWPAFAAATIRRHGITDVILHGEQRPYHKAAAAAASAEGAGVIVTELGLLRPDWMTLERDGTGASSRFPRTPEAIRALAARCPAPDLAPRHAAHFVHVAVPDVVYNLASTLLWPLHPYFRRHTIYFPPTEYLAWLGRLATASRRDRAARRMVDEVLAKGGPSFIMPLQLAGDFQIRVHSPFPDQADAVRHVLASFARHAPSDASLIVKSHPLDNGLERYGRAVTEAAAAHGVGDRVRFMDGGSLAWVLPAAAGLVTINSSAGLEALRAGVPVHALGPAIYHVAGLTHAGPLELFWSDPPRPDPDLVRDLVRALAGTTQVRGTIYSRDGLESAVDGMTARILADGFLAPQA